MYKLVSSLPTGAAWLKTDGAETGFVVILLPGFLALNVNPFIPFFWVAWKGKRIYMYLIKDF